MFTAWKTDTSPESVPRLPPASAPSSETQQFMTARGRKDYSGTSAPKDAHSMIDEWLTMRGDLESEGDILVKGRVHGNVHCRILIIDTNATVEGGISAQEVVIRGTARGTIRTKRIRLEKTAVVDCEIFHESFAAEEGARVTGTLHAQDSEPATASGLVAPAGSFSQLADASLKELFARPEPSPDMTARPSSSLYQMLEVARAANETTSRTT